MKQDLALQRRKDLLKMKVKKSQLKRKLLSDRKSMSISRSGSAELKHRHSHAKQDKQGQLVTPKQEAGRSLAIFGIMMKNKKQGLSGAKSIHHSLKANTRTAPRVENPVNHLFGSAEAGKVKIEKIEKKEENEGPGTSKKGENAGKSLLEISSQYQHLFSYLSQPSNGKKGKKEPTKNLSKFRPKNQSKITSFIGKRVFNGSGQPGLHSHRPAGNMMSRPVKKLKVEKTPQNLKSQIKKEHKAKKISSAAPKNSKKLKKEAKKKDEAKSSTWDTYVFPGKIKPKKKKEEPSSKISNPTKTKLVKKMKKQAKKLKNPQKTKKLQKNLVKKSEAEQTKIESVIAQLDSVQSEIKRLGFHVVSLNSKMEILQNFLNYKLSDLDKFLGLAEGREHTKSIENRTESTLSQNQSLVEMKVGSQHSGLNTSQGAAFPVFRKRKRKRIVKIDPNGLGGAVFQAGVVSVVGSRRVYLEDVMAGNGVVDGGVEPPGGVHGVVGVNGIGPAGQ